MTKIEQDLQNENIDTQTLIQIFFSTYPEYIEHKDFISEAWNFLIEKTDKIYQLLTALLI